MTKPYPEGTVFVSTPLPPGSKVQPEGAGAGFAPVYVPYGNGAAWVAPGYGNVQPAGGGPRVIVGPDGSVLVEVTELPPPAGTAPIPAASGPDPVEPKSGAGLLAIAALLALLFAS